MKFMDIPGVISKLTVTVHNYSLLLQFNFLSSSKRAGLYVTSVRKHMMCNLPHAVLADETTFPYHTFVICIEMVF